jgi:hypothetical protein
MGHIVFIQVEQPSEVGQLVGLVFAESAIEQTVFQKAAIEVPPRSPETIAEIDAMGFAHLMHSIHGHISESLGFGQDRLQLSHRGATNPTTQKRSQAALRG